MHPANPVVSVVIPVHNGATTLHRCLRALMRSTYQPWQGIVVDDGSDDGSSDVARRLHFPVLRSGIEAHGPAWARNEGARVADGEILLFIDADVAVYPDTIARMVSVLQQERHLAACFGSYDMQPAATNFLSQYKNLLHHFTHQNGDAGATTFWAGCGAIYREVFWQIGGFDESFSAPSIEDIELGVRLHRHEYAVRLEPQVQVTHLKRWDARSLLHSDIRQRALPWSRLIATQRRIPDDLNLARGQRVSALAAWGLLAGLVLMPYNGNGLALAFLCLLTLLALNGRFYHFLVTIRGMGFAARVLPWHCLYFLYSSATFALVWLAVRAKQLSAAALGKGTMEPPVGA